LKRVLNNKGPSIKDVRTQGEGGFVQCGHFADKGRGVLQMRTSTLFDAKKLRIFWNLWSVRTDKGGRGPIFRDFVLTPIWTAPKVSSGWLLDLKTQLTGSSQSPVEMMLYNNI